MDTPLRDLRTTMSPHGPKERTKGRTLQRKAYGHKGRSIPANDGPAHRFAGCARACALMGSGLSLEGPAIHEKAADVAVFDAVIDGRAYSIVLMGDSLRARSVGIRREGLCFVG